MRKKEITAVSDGAIAWFVLEKPWNQMEEARHIGEMKKQKAKQVIDCYILMV